LNHPELEGQEVEQKPRRTHTQLVGLLLGPVLAAVVFGLNWNGGRPPVPARMAAVAVVMAVWWITDALPLAATALLPIVAYPLLGIMRGEQVAPVYVNSTIFLFLSGFMIALTMERWNLHKRIALWIIRLVSILGGGPAGIVLGFMLAAAFLSMWISNTATAVMMVPIGLAIVLKMEESFGQAETHRFTLALMLGIAYGCSVGGITTLVGTPPNLSFARIFAITFPDAPAVTFGQWLIMALPIGLALLAVIWVLLTRVFCRVPAHLRVDPAIVHKEYEQLGKIAFEEAVVLATFSTTAVLWVFRKDLTFGDLIVPGWSRLLPYPDWIDDATVAMSMALLLFFVPTRSPGESRTIMSGEVITRLPWHIVLLFGGGFALARGFQASGLSTVIGNEFAGLRGLPPLVVILVICLALTFLTELTSNTATTEMILPILASVAVAMETNPLLLMIPATLSASCAFMMPVATPPNAIVFGSGRIKIAEMARIGVVLNLIGVVIVTLGVYFLGRFVFDIDTSTFPEWARHMKQGTLPR
jgi:sodium-dependent dicarboxylate transporter 2/3/5